MSPPMLQPPLDWPHYGIGLRGAIVRGFKKYAASNSYRKSRDRCRAGRMPVACG